MHLYKHWRKLLILSSILVVTVTVFSVYLMEDYVRGSFVLWIYLIAPIIAYIFASIFVWIGTYIMRFNDSVNKHELQLTWFLRLMASVGCVLLLSDVAPLLLMKSGHMPIAFTLGL